MATAAPTTVPIEVYLRRRSTPIATLWMAQPRREIRASSSMAVQGLLAAQFIPRERDWAILDPIERTAYRFTPARLLACTGPRLTIADSPIYLDLPELFSSLD